MASEFPKLLLHEASHDWNIAGNTKSPGGSTSLPAVTVRSDGGGFWTASLNDIQLWYREYALLWRAVRQVAAGGVNPLVVRRMDQLQPFPAGGPTTYGAIPHGDGALFSDGSGYAQPVIDVKANAAAALRAVSLDLNLVNCASLVGGEVFSIGHATFGPRMYEIGTVTPLGGAFYRVTFNPPLREAVTAGTVIEFDEPRCTMKLVNASGMDLNLTVLPDSTATVKLVETRFA